MQIDYERTASHSYLVMAEAEYSYAVYEWEMLQNNEIRGLIPFRPISENGQEKYWYDITGLQAMETVLQNGMVRADLVKRMICSLADLKLMLENYMLEEGAVCFRPELIFFDRRSKEMRFCLIPGYQNENTEGMRPMLELLLNHLDHSDKIGMRMAYRLYELCADGSCGREELLGCIQAGDAAAEGWIGRTTAHPGYAEAIEQTEKPKDIKNVKQVEKYKNDLYQTGCKEREQISSVYGEDRDSKHSGTQSRKSGNGITERIHRMKQRKFGETEKTEKKRNRKEGRSRFSSEGKSADYGAGLAGGLFGSAYGVYEASAEGYTGEFSMTEEAPLPEESVTELVQQPEHTGEVRLIYRGNGEEPDLCVDHFPYLIGKRTGGADGILQAETVSRVHARILLDPEQGLCVQDMNSTNGTRLNGDLIPFHTPVPVKKNDRLMFGTEVFVIKGEL
jgi:hypothetical protein